MSGKGRVLADAPDSAHSRAARRVLARPSSKVYLPCHARTPALRNMTSVQSGRVLCGADSCQDGQ